MIEVQVYRESGWFGIDNEVVDHWIKVIGPTAYSVYCTLCRYANSSHQCWPSVNTISDKTGISRASIFNAIKLLCDKGLIRKEAGIDGSVNVYTILKVVQNLDHPVQNLDGRGLKNDMGGVQNLDPNKTNITIPKEQYNVHELKTEKQPIQKQSSAAFDAVYGKYPRKMGRKAALRHFNASIHTSQDLADINMALDNYIAYLTKNNIEFQYTQMASTWFNNWRDWLTVHSTEPKKATGAAGREL